MIIAGVGRAEREHGLEIDLVEPLVDPEDDLKRLAEAGTDLIIVARDFDVAVDRIAPEYPDVHWVAIDPAAVHIEEPNLSELHFDVADSAFVAGAAARFTTRTGKIGFVGGYQTFRSEQSRNGFEQGAGWFDADIDIVSQFLGPVANPVVDGERRDDLAYEAAVGMYESGVDVIFHDAGVAGAGVIRAANEWSTSGSEVWAIGSDANEFLTLPESQRDVVLTSTIKRFDAAVDIAITSFINGELEPGETVLGMADAAVALSRDGGRLAQIDGRLKNLEGELEIGHILVSADAVRAPRWQSEPDLALQLTLTDDVCTVDEVAIDGTSVADEITSEARLAVKRDSVIGIELTNVSSDVGGLSVHSAPPGKSVAELAEESRRAPGPAASLGPIHAISTVQLGGRTGAAVLITDSPLSINCFNGPAGRIARDNFALIVSPT
jgi:basic membrane protein A